jgi:hypothetical protein
MTTHDRPNYAKPEAGITATTWTCTPTRYEALLTWGRYHFILRHDLPEAGKPYASLTLSLDKARLRIHGLTGWADPQRVHEGMMRLLSKHAAHLKDASVYARMDADTLCKTLTEPNGMPIYYDSKLKHLRSEYPAYVSPQVQVHLLAYGKIDAIEDTASGPVGQWVDDQDDPRLSTMEGTQDVKVTVHGEGSRWSWSVGEVKQGEFITKKGAQFAAEEAWLEVEHGAQS